MYTSEIQALVQQNNKFYNNCTFSCNSNNLPIMQKSQIDDYVCSLWT